MGRVKMGVLCCHVMLFTNCSQLLLCRFSTLSPFTHTNTRKNMSASLSSFEYNIHPASPNAPVPPNMLRLVSGDGFTFIIREEYAMVSSVIRTMMNSSFKESHTRIIHLPEISGNVLEKICQYFYYIPRYRQGVRQSNHHSTHQNKPSNTILIPMSCFTENFDIPQQLSLELFLAAKYLDL